jgi:hypothetical protein
MNEREPLDLSPLAPEGWEAVVETTLRRVDGVLTARAQDPLTLIASWSRSLSIAAVVVVALLVPVELLLERREARAEQVDSLVQLTTRATIGAQPPTGAELSRALGQGPLP